MSFSTVGSCSDVCCCVPGSWAGRLGQCRQLAGAAGESPEMSVTGKVRLLYLGESFMETHACLLCKSSATQGKVINLSESLMSILVKMTLPASVLPCKRWWKWPWMH